MDKKKRLSLSYSALIGLLIAISVAAWASIVPAEVSVRPTVTINQAAGQADPALSAPIRFAVRFNKAVTGFTAADVTLSGTAPGALTTTVTGSGTTYEVAVSGMTGSGTVTADVAADRARDAVGNGNVASTSNDNTVTFDVVETPLTVTINQAATQADPTNSGPIHFTVVFSNPVVDFAADDVTLSGTAPGSRVSRITRSGRTYGVSVSGMTGAGTVIATLAAGVAHDSPGNANMASTSTDNTVTFGVAIPVTPLTVTVNQAASQADPTNNTPIRFTVVFSQPVTDFSAADVTLRGTAPGILIKSVTGAGSTYDVSVSGMTGAGTVIATLAAGVAHDSPGNANMASTSTDNTVTFNNVTIPVVPLTVTINQAASQADPTNTAFIRFTVRFSRPVTGFTATDVTLRGTAPGARVSRITGSGSIYDVAVSA
jgi:UDP-3-O-acyl-N-acetylglucosamine deacetylase